jgi:hypothetical protein
MRAPQRAAETDDETASLIIIQATQSISSQLPSNTVTRIVDLETHHFIVMHNTLHQHAYEKKLMAPADPRRDGTLHIRGLYDG